MVQTARQKRVIGTGYVLFLLLTAIGTWGCSSFGASFFSYSEKLYIEESNIPVYERKGEKGVGDVIGHTTFSRGDTIQHFGTRLSAMSTKHCYLIIYEGDSVWVKEEDGVIPLYDHIVRMQPDQFRLHKDKDEEAWGRAMRFITIHSDMKVQTTSDLLIETYNPIDNYDRGFRVSRLPVGDSVEYVCTCLGLNCDSYEKQMALYMSTGIRGDHDL